MYWLFWLFWKVIEDIYASSILFDKILVNTLGRCHSWFMLIKSILLWYHLSEYRFKKPYLENPYCQNSNNIHILNLPKFQEIHILQDMYRDKQKTVALNSLVTEFSVAVGFRCTVARIYISQSRNGWNFKYLSIEVSMFRIILGVYSVSFRQFAFQKEVFLSFFFLFWSFVNIFHCV